MAGNNGVRRGEQRDKPFREALRMEIAAAGENFKRLRVVARALLAKAETGDVSAIREIGDRLDGKPAQALEHTGADGGAIELDHMVDVTKLSPEELTLIERIMSQSEDNGG
jgi:hypothetical protein